MKIGIIGDEGAELFVISAALTNANHEVIAIFEDDIKEEAAAIAVFCGSPVPNVGGCIIDCKDDSYDDGKQHWRAGSRGKGGKIKYERR